MERIYLTSKERQILKIIFATDETNLALLRKKKFIIPLMDLRDKGFIEYSTDGDDLIDDIVITRYAVKYCKHNPYFKNPFNWQLCQLIVTIILTIATIIGLFIGCTLLNK